MSVPTPEREIKVLIVDDHPLMRAGIAGEINAQSDMRVIAEAEDGDVAVELFRKLQPDITLMDIKMPRMNGIDALIGIRSKHASVKPTSYALVF